jgi:hypothetical protein
MNRKCQIRVRLIWLATLLYLMVPVAIFALGWLNLPLALLVTASLVMGIIFSRDQASDDSSISVPLWFLVLLTLSSIALCLFAGVGGYAYQDGDYFKHNAVLSDLFRREWPVTYSIERAGVKHTAALVYYFAYYLPPALIGKMAGWEALRCSMVLWSAGGLWIVSLWCVKLSKNALWAPLAFLAFGGLDIVGMFLGLKVWSWMPELWIHHRQMEWWTGFSFGNYPSHSNHFFWAPQHSLPGWLIAAALLHRIRSGSLASCLFLAALSILWSPLVGLGLLPIGLAGLLVTRGKDAFARSNLAAVPLLMVSVLFFAARGVPELQFPEIPSTWNDLVPSKLLVTFILEVLPWTLLLFIPTKAAKSDLTMILSCAMFLVILPFWRIGAFNDLMMKGSLPAFAILSMLLIQKYGVSSQRWKRVALITLIAGSGGFAFDLYRHADYLGDKANQMDFSAPGKVPVLPATPDLVGLLDQYLGSPDSFFFRRLSQPLPSVVDSVAYNEPAPPPGAIDSQNRMQKNLRHRFENGERSLELLSEYATLCYYQGDLWDSILALETLIELNPKDPNSRINLANLLSQSGIKAFRERALHELDAARELVADPTSFDRDTDPLRQSLKGNR